MFQSLPHPDASQLADLKGEHLQSLSFPLDAYWEEALIGFAQHVEIQWDGQRVGFYCLNDAHQLVAFHLSPPWAHHGEQVFRHVLNQHGVHTALAGTHDALFLSLSLDHAKSTQVHTLLFEDRPARPTLPERSLTFAPATDDDFQDVLAHYVAANESMDTDSIEAGFAHLEGYLRSVLEQHHIFTLRDGNQLLATSECRISTSQPPYADVGMIVAKTHRRQGLGSYMLSCTKGFCYERDLRPICSCEASNIGSQKAIQKAGFVSRHRVVEVELEILAG